MLVRRGLSDLAMGQSAVALVEARARTDDAMADVAGLRSLVATHTAGDKSFRSCSRLRSRYETAVAKIRKSLAAIRKIDITDYEATEYAYVVRDHRRLVADYNTTLDQMLYLQGKLNAACA